SAAVSWQGQGILPRSHVPHRKSPWPTPGQKPLAVGREGQRTHRAAVGLNEPTRALAAGDIPKADGIPRTAVGGCQPLAVRPKGHVWSGYGKGTALLTLAEVPEADCVGQVPRNQGVAVREKPQERDRTGVP